MTLGGSLGRFILVGGLNTLASIVIYQIALFVMPPAGAYVLCWCVGLVFVGAVTPSFVFRSESGLRGSGRIVLLYLLTFALGLGLTELLTVLGMHQRAVIFLVVVLTAVCNYTGGRLLLTSEDRIAR